MASNTPNYNLKKPAAADFYHVEDQNANMDKLDAALKGLAVGKAPATHADQHAAGGSDPVTPASIGAATANHTHTPESIGAAPAGHTHDDRYFTEAESLSAATAALYGLGSGAVPDDVLSWVGKYNRYWWKRRTNTSHFEPVYGTASNYSVLGSQSAGVSSIQIQYSDELEFDSLGNALLKGPTTINANTLYSDPAVLDQHAYFRSQVNPSGSYQAVRYAYPGSAVATKQYSDSTYYIYKDSKPITSTWVEACDEWEFVRSSERNTYPDSGESGGYEYQYLGIPFDNAAKAPKLETVSYVGTGTYGSANPTTMTFSFLPKAVVYIGQLNTNGKFDAYNGFAIPCSGFGTIPNNFWYEDIHYLTLTVSASDKTVSFVGSNAVEQHNVSGIIYYYIAIG